MGCRVQGNPQLNNKRDQKGCQHGSKDIFYFKRLHLVPKTLFSYHQCSVGPSQEQAPARHRLLLGCPSLEGKAKTLPQAGSWILQSWC